MNLTDRNYLMGSLRAAICSCDMPRPYGVNYMNVLAYIRHNQIASIVYPVIRNDAACPEIVKSELRKDFLFSAQCAENQNEEAQILLDECEQLGIRAMPLKGYFLKNYYPSTLLRASADVDILVDDVNVFDPVIRAHGFKKIGDELTHTEYHKEPFVTVEAHKWLVSPKVGNNEYFGTFERAKLMEGKKYIYELSKEDFYLHILGHAAKHVHTGGIGVRFLADIYVLKCRFGDQMDREYIKKELETSGLTEFERHVTRLADDCFNGAAIEGFYSRLLDYFLGSGASGTEHNKLAYRFSKQGVSIKKAKRRHVLRRLFPTYEFMSRNRRYLRKCPVLLPFAWCARIAKEAFVHNGKKETESLEHIDEKRIETVNDICKTLGL